MRRILRGREGVTLLHVLFLVVLVGYMSSLAARGWTLAAKRERERELIFRGLQYRSAIGRYWWFEGKKQYPLTIDALLLDPRSPAIRRHLRKGYLDPMSSQPFLLIREKGGGIVGVRSRSEEDPVGPPPPLQDMAAALSDAEKGYAKWQFLFMPPPPPPETPSKDRRNSGS